MIERIAQLVVKYLQGELTDDENQELQAWIYQSRENELAFEKATDPENLKEGLKREFEKEERILDQLKSGFEKEIENEAEVLSISTKRKWYRYVAAAAMIIIMASAIIYLWPNKDLENTAVADSENSGRFKNDVMPGNEKATLTLADGKVISLDSTGKGLLATQGIAAISNANGELIYSVQNVNAVTAADIKNIVSTRKGGEYRLMLSDGTKIWLNAASSLTFPVAFTGDERKVEITGEAYFEVAKDSSKPFKVLRAGTDLEIKVLGTKYNVQAYDGEPVRVTLLEGSVKVSQTEKNNSEILSPGDQAQVNETGIKLISNPDLEDVIAWKNGIFLLNGKSLREILEQVERWYNVEIKYQTETTVKFRGKISRDEPLSKLLMILEMTNEVEFSIDGRNLTVMPGKKN